MKKIDFTSFSKPYNRFKKVYNRLLTITLKRLNVKANIYVSCIICDNDYIHKINRDYRKIDRPTDVISFAFLDDGKRFDLLNQKCDIILGEIYISYQKGIEQAKEYGHSLDREMSFLFVHGLLHLLGYDHQNKMEEEIMFNLQEEILSSYQEENNMTNEKELVASALKARELSYSPYSNFAVGAALLCKDGDVILGANIENSSYPLSMCAERNAIYSAYLKGKKKEDIVALAIVADSDNPCSPCGACRQVMSELLSKDCKIILANVKGDMKVVSVNDLLPFAFSSEDLNK